MQKQKQKKKNVFAKEMYAMKYSRRHRNAIVMMAMTKKTTTITNKHGVDQVQKWKTIKRENERDWLSVRVSEWVSEREEGTERKRNENDERIK